VIEPHTSVKGADEGGGEVWKDRDRDVTMFNIFV
jgi:hypothetical protein